MEEIEEPLSKISEISPYKYDYISNIINEEGDTVETHTKEYGFISQQIKEALPEVKITMEEKESLLLMDYDQIIPILVAGMQEQQAYISAMQAQIAMLTASCCDGVEQQNTENNSISGSSSSDTSDTSKLFDNTPNPFIGNTNIDYYLTDNIANAYIKIWDMQGVEQKKINLPPVQGHNQVSFDGNSNLQTTGTYIYALFVDKIIIDSKMMIYGN